MKAAMYENYGPPEVVCIRDIPPPEPGSADVLVRVHASAVNTSDWRIRAAAFPGITALPGRLMYGVFRPRYPMLGSEFAGVVDSVGADVAQFEVGQRVFGMTTAGGATAKYMAIPASKAIAQMPPALSFEQAAALPFGGLAALVFLRDFGKLSRGQRVLIVGASGGVGCYAVQIAKAMGGHVTGVAGPNSQALLAKLGADEVLDYQSENWMIGLSPFDLILDTYGALRPAAARRLLKPSGVFLPLNFGVRELLSACLNPLLNGSLRIGVNADRAEDLDLLTEMVASGRLKPITDRVFDLADIVEAHRHVEGRHRQGAVVLRH